MVNVIYKGEYDAERNILFNKIINKPQTFEDIDYLVNQDAQWYRKGGENKVWNITDISEMGMASVKLVTYYEKQGKPLIDKYLIDYCVICSKPLEKIAAQLFSILSREKHPILKTREQGIDWVLNEQRARGRFVPL